MPIAVTGSVATDHLMSFPGLFAESLVVDQLDKIALSFLVEDLEVRRGGCAANIAFGLAALGARPILVAAVGEDFADYRSWLERHGVDCDSLHYSETRHTARFICTTDRSHAQIASFYAGAMTRGPARSSSSRSWTGSVRLDLVVIAPNDPEAMLRHTQECRRPRLPVRGRPVPAARVLRRPDDPRPDRRRRDPAVERVRSRADRAEDRLEPPTRSSSGSAPASSRSARRASGSRREASEPIEVPAVPGVDGGRADRCR